MRHNFVISIPQSDYTRLNEYSQKVFDVSGKYIKDVKFIGQEQSVASAFDDFSKSLFIYDWNGMWYGIIGFGGEILGDTKTFLKREAIETIVKSLVTETPKDFPAKYFNLEEFRKLGIDLVEQWNSQTLWNVSVAGECSVEEYDGFGRVTNLKIENVMLTGIEKYLERKRRKLTSSST